MPTIIFINGFQFIIWPDDHEPPHVHIFKGDGHAKVRIGNSDQAPTLITIYGLTKREARFIWSVVAEHQEILLDVWRKIHG